MKHASVECARHTWGPVEKGLGSPVSSSLLQSSLSRAVMNTVQRGASSSACSRLPQPPLIPGLKRCSILVTQEQIQRLVSKRTCTRHAHTLTHLPLQVSLSVYAEENVTSSSPTDQDLRRRLNDAISVFTPEELSSPSLLLHPYAVEAVDADSRRLSKLMGIHLHASSLLMVTSVAGGVTDW